MNEATRTGQILIACVDCRETVILSGDVRIGQQVICPSCLAQMEVIALEPMEVDWLYEEPEYAYEDEESQ